MKVKPATPGAIVRDPHSRLPLPAEGANVPESTYWVRRLQSGDVVLAEEPGSLARPVDEVPRPELSPIMPLATRARRTTEDKP